MNGSDQDLIVDWHTWRGGGIGSSDVAAILGLSPYTTKLELWRQKTGRAERVLENDAMYRGTKFEPKARASFELETMEDYPPRYFQSEQFPFMRVSLDGWNEESRTILEIKCPGKETLRLAREEKKLPEHYEAQVQYQLFVANASKAIYWAFDPESEKGYRVDVEPNLDFIQKMIKEVVSFWVSILIDEEPAPGPRDYVDFPEDMQKMVEMFKQSLKSKVYRDMILLRMPHTRARGWGLRVSVANGKARFMLDKKEAEAEASPSLED